MTAATRLAHQLALDELDAKITELENRRDELAMSYVDDEEDKAWRAERLAKMDPLMRQFVENMTTQIIKAGNALVAQDREFYSGPYWEDLFKQVPADAKIGTSLRIKLPNYSKKDRP